MLENINLKQKLKKKEYRTLSESLALKLGELQRKAREQKLPVLIIFEGWDASGKGTLINNILLALDPRGFNVCSTFAPCEEEKLRPFLWPFWLKIPERGKITIFDRSYYSRALMERVDGKIDKALWVERLGEFKSFERQLVDDGYVIVKLFLHISRKMQKKRFEMLEANKSSSWRVTKHDWVNHKRYDELLKQMDYMLVETDTGFAPWTVIEAHDSRFAHVKAMRTVIKAIEDGLERSEKRDVQRMVEKEKGLQSQEAALKPLSQKEKIGRKKGENIDDEISLNSEQTMTSILSKVDLTKKLSPEEYERKLEKYQKIIRDLEYEVYRKRLPVVIVYEGCDAGGKGGSIKRLVERMDPRGYTVIPVAAPNDIERAHHYLWRFWRHFPKAGHIAIFDRSWYGRVLVERIEGFCSTEEWKRAYMEINEMEEHWANYGTVIVKFWLQIDKDEQLRRFRERQSRPEKQWKLTEEDWRNREKWDAYQIAVDEMLVRTSTSHAPWTIIEANDKLYARIKALETVISSIKRKL